MGKNVQIPEDLFADLVKYFFGNRTDLEATIMDQLQEKADKMYARQQYMENLNQQRNGEKK